MRIHKEGYGVIAKSFAIIATIFLCIFLICGWNMATKISLGVGLVLFFFIIRFFRSPKRVSVIDKGSVIAAADGKIVIVQEVEENEFLKERCIQVSIFMSIFNVHVNYYPVAGKVLYSKHHHGEYLVAYYPKASEKNERTSIAVETPCGKKILFRQIAGYIARRIVCYAKEGDQANQCSQVGFIKFGSRVDIFVPLGSDVKVKVGDHVRACQTVIAKLAE
ncbi:MAG: phosphatidylserine decarboxylase family protein [Bacteroidales bacterium]|nr:phosphatidylserine decarboxylase family protein [Bacteroidales bacterium]